MCIKNLILIILLILPFGSKSQIRIDEAGDWKPRVDSAIELIRNHSPEKYQILINNCNYIEFIMSDHSSVKYPNTIAISTNDMKLNSLNNIASILVHESYHLYLFNNHIYLSDFEEERVCYKWEYDFLCSLPEVEDWLIKHVIKQTIKYTTLEK